MTGCASRLLAPGGGDCHLGHITGLQHLFCPSLSAVQTPLENNCCLPVCWCRVVTLLSTQADQLLLPFAGNEVTVTVTVESDSDYSQPLNILLDNQPCQIEVTEELASRPAQVWLFC